MAILAACALFTIGCGHEASVLAPSPLIPPRLTQEPALAPGSYWLEVSAPSITDSSRTTCHIVALTPYGTWVTTPVQLERVGTEWVATSRPGYGSIDLRFHPAAPSSARGVPLVGMLRGAGLDASPAPIRPAQDVQVDVSGPGDLAGAGLNGFVSPLGTIVTGYLAGTLTFRDRFGIFATCPAALWALRPSDRLPPG